MVGEVEGVSVGVASVYSNALRRVNRHATSRSDRSHDRSPRLLHRVDKA